MEIPDPKENWGAWCEWVKDVTGVSVRMRKCLNDRGEGCEGNDYETKKTTKIEKEKKIKKTKKSKTSEGFILELVLCKFFI